MQVGRKYVNIWKKIFFVTFCMGIMAGLTGCGKDNTQENVTAAPYNTGNGDNGTEKPAQTSGKIADTAEQRYYESLDELTRQGGGIDISLWEGDDAIDKWSRRIMYWWTCVYRAIKRHIVEIIAVNTLTGAMLAIFATKNKQVRRFGIFNLCIYLNSVMLLFVIIVGLVNHFYTV